jgi:hypothetical protein
MLETIRLPSNTTSVQLALLQSLRKSPHLRDIHSDSDHEMHVILHLIGGISSCRLTDAAYLRREHYRAIGQIQANAFTNDKLNTRTDPDAASGTAAG